MTININLDEKSLKELNELAAVSNSTKSQLIRNAIKELYLKEKMAKENLLFFVDLYNEGIITKDVLFTPLPVEDAKSIIIGSSIGEEAVKIAKNIDG